MRVIFDIDDVLIPWAETAHQACMTAGLVPGHVTTWTQWGMWEDYGCTKDQWLEVINAMTKEGGVYHAPPYPGAVEAMQKLVDAGHDAFLVTARGFFANADLIRQWTYEWVETFKVPGILYFARENKGEVAAEIGATHGIDDRRENVVSLLGAGVDAYLMNQPHNLSWDYVADRRVNSVAEFVERIL